MLDTHALSTLVVEMLAHPRTSGQW